MEPGGIHLLLTYKCNASCAHCFLSCGPRRSGLVSLEEASKYIAGAESAPYIDHFFIEGGEPFLYPELLTSIAASIIERGYWLGILTNGFWAVDDEAAHAALRPLAEAGLNSLGISTDAWHSRFVPLDRARRAERIATGLGIDADLMVCAGGPGTDEDNKSVLDRLKAGGSDILPGRVICRGRAAASGQCLTGSRDWQTLESCPAGFGGRERVHVGPHGQIHLCQGLLLGRDARSEPLAEIFAGFRPEKHPVCAALDAGGPAALAMLAMESGFVPAAVYADGCHLCFEARRHLLQTFPELIGPAQMYKTT